MATSFKENIKYTYEDYLKTPDNERYELIEGELLMTPSPNPRHQKIVGRLHIRISHYVSEMNLGEVLLAPCDVVLGKENVFQPDILFVSNQNSGIITEANVEGAPDLIIEILSPSTAYRDLIKKKRIYAQFGVKEYWIVDPEEETAELYILKDGLFSSSASYRKDDILTTPLLKGLKIPLGEIFTSP